MGIIHHKHDSLVMKRVWEPENCCQDGQAFQQGGVMVIFTFVVLGQKKLEREGKGDRPGCSSMLDWDVDSQGGAWLVRVRVRSPTSVAMNNNFGLGWKI